MATVISPHARNIVVPMPLVGAVFSGREARSWAAQEAMPRSCQIHGEQRIALIWERR
jgi:hypothetical protein